MSIRRIVAANKDGRSRIVSDEAAVTNAFSAVPGFDPIAAWGTAPEAGLVPNNRAAGGASLVPVPGGTTCFVVTFPPDIVMASPDFDGAAAQAEYGARLPGLADRFEAENPGMHQTNTIDYDILLDGELWAEFDDGEVCLKPGDILVQHGTRHAWRNRSDKPATILFVLVGANAA